MKHLIKNELSTFVNRGLDRHVRLAVTGLSRSGKTAFITSLVNQLLHVNTGARLPLFSAVREGRVKGIKRIPQRDLAIPRFAYDEGMHSLLSEPPTWPVATRGVSQIRLNIRYRPQHSLLRHLSELATLNLEIVDYPGEWLLDLPLLDQSYLHWSQQMTGMVLGARVEWAQPWLTLAAQCDPFAPADENLLAEIAQAYTAYLQRCKDEGLHFIQPGRFILPGDLAGAPVLQFFPWAGGLHTGPNAASESELLTADKNSNFGLLQARFEHYCQHVVKGFYRDHFSRFDRQIVLVDCLQPLNIGPQAFNDMRLALAQLMQSFHYGKRTLLRRLFAPCIDKLMFAATKADHVTPDQHANLVSLLQQLVQEAWQSAAFEGINMDCVSLASVQTTHIGQMQYQGRTLNALRGNRLSDGEPLLIYPGDVPSRLPAGDFWQRQTFDFESFRPRPCALDEPLPHIRLDAVMEFLLGDKLR